MTVKAGIEPDGHLTAAGQLAVRPPVPSCTSLSNKLVTPLAGGVNVNVQLLFMVTFCLLPLFQLIVNAAPGIAIIIFTLETHGIIDLQENSARDPGADAHVAGYDHPAIRSRVFHIRIVAECSYAHVTKYIQRIYLRYRANAYVINCTDPDITCIFKPIV